MNTFSAVAAIWSYKKELKIVLTAFLLVLSLPVIAVFILIHTGINVVSDALVGVNPETKQVEVYDSATGEVVNEIEASISWPVTGVITLEFGQSSGYHSIRGLILPTPWGKLATPSLP